MALDNQGLCRSPVPKRLFVSEDDVDVGTDGLDNEEFLRQLCGKFGGVSFVVIAIVTLLIRNF